jgi:hypothetical protein
MSMLAGKSAPSSSSSPGADLPNAHCIGPDVAPGWLVLRTWRLRDVRFFAVDADTGAVLASSEAGQRVPITERVIQTPEAIFPLTLAPKQRVLTVVRIQGKTLSGGQRPAA